MDDQQRRRPGTPWRLGVAGRGGAAQAVKQLADVVLGAVGHMANGLGRVLEKVPGLGGVGRALREAGDSMLNARDKIDNAADDISNSLSTKPQQGADDAARALQNLAPRFSLAGNALINTLDKAFAAGNTKAAAQGARAGLFYAQEMYRQAPNAQNKAALMAAQAVSGLTQKVITAGGAGTATGRHYIDEIDRLRNSAGVKGAEVGGAAVLGLDTAKGPASASGAATGRGFADALAAQSPRTEQAGQSHHRGILGVFANSGRWLVSHGQNLALGLANGIYQKASAVYSFFQQLPGNLSRILGRIGSWLTSHGSALIGGMASGIGRGVGSVWTFFSSTLPNGIGRILSRIGSWLGNAGLSLINGLANGIGREVGAIWDFFGHGLSNGIGRVLGDTGRWLFDAGKHLVQGLINGITDKAQALWDRVKQLAQGVRDIWPFSPAKTGPLSGSGSMDIAGRKIVTMLDAGMRSQMPTLLATSAGLATAVRASANGDRIGVTSARLEVAEVTRIDRGFDKTAIPGRNITVYQTYEYKGPLSHEVADDSIRKLDWALGI